MKTQNPLIGRSTKSIGQNTFYTLNGQNIVRTKPMVVANPNTPAQDAQRTRFKAFVAAANSMPEDDLNLLFATKQTGRNRRSMLQSQLAPAYGSQLNQDPTERNRYVPTFDVEKLGKIGSGSVGYIGDLVEVTASQAGVEFAAAKLQALKANVVLDGDETHLFVVMVSEDGCMAKIGGNFTINEVDDAIEAGIALTKDDQRDWVEHGDKVYCYAVGGKLQLIGLGTFSIAKRTARVAATETHNVPV